jgi:hypothetical protein
MATESELGDLGYLVTGVVERHPTGGAWVLRVVQDDGTPAYFPLEQVLHQYEGHEVRLTLATMETINRLTALVGDVQIADGIGGPKASS